MCDQPAIWAGVPRAIAGTCTSRPIWTHGPWTWTTAAWRETDAIPSCRWSATCICSCCSWSPACTCPRWSVCTTRETCPWRIAVPVSSCPRRPPRKPPHGNRCSVPAYRWLGPRSRRCDRRYKSIQVYIIQRYPVIVNGQQSYKLWRDHLCTHAPV